MTKVTRKIAATMVAALMLSGALAGCGGGSPADASPSSSSSEQASANSDEAVASPAEPASAMPYKGETVTYAVSDTAAQNGETIALKEMVLEKTGINLEFIILPTPAAGEVDRKLVSLQAGDEIGLLYGTTPGLKPFYGAGVLTPIDDLATENAYDMKKIFGDSLPVMQDGKTYGLPAFNDVWLTLYNKKIFDDAGVEYPKAEGWTWSKYIETAKLLTDKSADVWGSFMLDYDCYNYMYAIQNGAEPYKEDGTANFDDPRFAESLKFFYGLGNTEKIQPDSVALAAGVYPWNAFVASGNMAMWPIGGWATSMLPNFEKYPREWKAGILPLPYPDGQSPSTLVVTGNYAIPSTAANKNASFEVVKCVAENQYTLGFGRIPARIDLSDEEIETYIAEKLIPKYEFDGITVEDIKSCWFDPARKILSEKIVGTADTSISQIWIEEGQLYGQGGKDLDTAVAAIQERSNKAIQESANN